MKKIFFLIITTILFSCSTDAEQIPESILEVKDLNLSISDITPNSIFTDLTYTTIEVSGGIIETKVLYKEYNNLEWIETNIGKIENLKNGVKYKAKGLLMLNTHEKETLEVTFTTPSFDTTTPHVAKMTSVNRKYTIELSTNNNLNESPELNGYIKIGNDSLPLSEINILSNNKLEVVLPENTQTFFENDNQYNVHKEFTLGITSGDFYTQFSGAENLRIYNKQPYIDNHKNTINGTCSNTIEYWDLRFEGHFWSTEGGFYDYTNDLYNNPKSIQIDIKNEDTNSVESFSSDTIDEDICNSPSYFELIELINDNWYFHGNNYLIVHLDKLIFNPGNYSIKIFITDHDNAIYDSNTLSFIIP